MIPVPVRAPDADGQLDLQTVMDRIYDDTGYADDISEGATYPRLNGDDAHWAHQVVPMASS